MTNSIVKIEIQSNNWLIGYYSDGRNVVLGSVKTEAGAKRMLARRAKQFGLIVKGDVAVQAGE